MAETCAPLGCPAYVRLAKQNACTGEPIPGATNGAFFKCSRNVTLENVVQDPDESVFESDCGIPDRYVLDSYVTGYTLTFEVAKFSPQTQALLRGDVLLADTGVNVGVIEVAVAGCNAQTVVPSFIAELFYKIRACDSTGTENYLRVVIGGVKFAPAASDKENKITFQRWVGQSFPMLTHGLVDGGNAGPYDDFPAAIVTDLTATDVDQLYTKIEFLENNTVIDTFDVAAGSCYTAVVPATP